jgi:RNA-directed DNA polymerase
LSGDKVTVSSSPQGQRVEIPKPGGGTRTLGIPTVQDRFIQQLLLQTLTPIIDPSFRERPRIFTPQS